MLEEVDILCISLLIRLVFAFHFNFCKSEMDSSNKQICRLCLDITPACECETIGESKKEILKVLMINIDFDISDYAVACGRCLEKLQDCFDFKSHCINTLMDVDMKVYIKTEDFKNGLMSHESGYETSRVCQLCQSLIEVECFNCTTDWKESVVFSDMIRSCFPKVDLNIVDKPVMCEPCLNSMKKYYEFMKSCQEVEQRIEYFRQVAGHGTADRVNLEDMLQFKDYNVPNKPLIIKKEGTDIDTVDEDVRRCLKNKETANIKCEEIDIKDELENGVEINDPNESEDCDSFGTDDLSKTDLRVRKLITKERKRFCPKCPYASNRRWALIRHMRSHSDNEVYKCKLCSFITDAKRLLKVHMTGHRGPSKEFVCGECSYKTYYYSKFVEHHLKHKDKSEVEMRKCLLCPFESKYKSKVVRHCKLKHNVDIKMYECKECSYTTTCNNSLVNHELMHEIAKEYTQHKCEKCEFQSKYESSLISHMRIHEDPNEEYKCTLCSFVTDAKLSLKVHMKSHRAPSKVFVCGECSYRTDHSGRFAQHNLKHKDKSEVEMQKCLLCPFESKYKSMVVRHCELKHKVDVQTSESKECSNITGCNNSLVSQPGPKHKCDKCGFKSKYKPSLNRHMMTHEDPKMVNKFKCEKCPYQTKLQCNLKRHMRIHSNMYRCDQCTYSNNNSTFLLKHKALHDKDGERQLYKALLRSKKAKNKNSTKDHIVETYTDSSEVS